MSILKLEPNKPLQISLKYKSGKEVGGRYGMQVQYVLSSGDLLYLPAIAAEQVTALNPGPGEPFTLLKAVKPGNEVVWSVERATQPKAPQSPAVPMPAKNGNSHPAPASALTTVQSRRVMAQLVAAIEVVRAAEAYASQTLARPVTFSPEDIRALAISAFISQSREV